MLALWHLFLISEPRRAVQVFLAHPGCNWYPKDLSALFFLQLFLRSDVVSDGLYQIALFPLLTFPQKGCPERYTQVCCLSPQVGSEEAVGGQPPSLGAHPTTAMAGPRGAQPRWWLGAHQGKAMAISPKTPTGQKNPNHNQSRTQDFFLSFFLYPSISPCSKRY